MNYIYVVREGRGFRAIYYEDGVRRASSYAGTAQRAAELVWNMLGSHPTFFYPPVRP